MRSGRRAARRAPDAASSVVRHRDADTATPRRDRVDERSNHRSGCSAPRTPPRCCAAPGRSARADRPATDRGSTPGRRRPASSVAAAIADRRRRPTRSPRRRADHGRRPRRRGWSRSSGSVRFSDMTTAVSPSMTNAFSCVAKNRPDDHATSTPRRAQEVVRRLVAPCPPAADRESPAPARPAPRRRRGSPLRSGPPARTSSCRGCGAAMRAGRRSAPCRHRARRSADPQRPRPVRSAGSCGMWRRVAVAAVPHQCARDDKAVANTRAGRIAPRSARVVTASRPALAACGSSGRLLGRCGLLGRSGLLRGRRPLGGRLPRWHGLLGRRLPIAAHRLCPRRLTRVGARLRSPASGVTAYTTATNGTASTAPGDPLQHAACRRSRWRRRADAAAHSGRP